MIKRILAALMFFTRLPLWRIVKVEGEYFKKVVPLWSLTGWLTGGVTVLVFFLSWRVFPITISIIIAYTVRILLTGALHEDGFADFCDGFGGGTDKKRTLEIMKDSHIGTYGVIGLILYFILLVSSISHLDSHIIIPTIICADTFSKFAASNIINILPYSRREEEAKNKLIYSRMTITDFIISLLAGILPLLLLPEPKYILAGCPVLLLCLFLFTLMKRKIGGYTGDCCGATAILSEQVFVLSVLALQNI